MIQLITGLAFAYFSWGSPLCVVYDTSSLTGERTAVRVVCEENMKPPPFIEPKHEMWEFGKFCTSSTSCYFGHKGKG